MGAHVTAVAARQPLTIDTMDIFVVVINWVIYAIRGRL